MKVQKILAGIIAAAAVLNLSVPINAFEDETEHSPVQIDGVVIYDPVTHTYSYENGDPYVPKDHNPGIWDDIVSDVELPPKYDTRELFKEKNLPFPEIKNQNPTGSCWAHAALAASEINGILKGVVDPNNCNFSEAHLNYFAIVGDPDPDSDLYGDTVEKFKGVSSFNDYYSIYNNGGNMPLAASVLSRGSGPVFEPPEWDIGYATDNSVVIFYYSGNIPVVFDKVYGSQLYVKNGYYCYMKDGKEIVLNGAPYFRDYNIKNNLYFTPIDEQYRYDSEYTLVNADSYYYDYDASDINSISNIKEAVMEKGCLTLGYYADNRNSMVSSQYGYYLPQKALAASEDGVTESTPKSQLPKNHSISIIGWDDDYAVENFYSDQSEYSFSKWVEDNGSLKKVTTTFNADELRPQKKGAWLCRNSWGSSYGNGGYFYISYEEPEINEIYSYDLESNQLYGEKIYQNFGATSNTYLIRNSGYSAANIFTAEADDTITAISFFTNDLNCDYSYSIYTGVTSGSPISGTLVASGSGFFENGGYHTVDLQTPVSVAEGENFSIFLSTNDTLCCMDTYNKQKGISFLTYSMNSTNYYDTYNLSGKYNFNIWLKALTAGTQTVKPEAPANLSAIPGDGQALLYWDPVENAEKYTIYYDEQKNGNYVRIASVDNAYRIMKTLTNDGVYRFAVTATVNGVESDYSAPVDAIPQAGASIINIPTGLEATAGDSCVSLKWNTVNGAKSYKVYYSTVNNRYTSALYSTVTTNSCTVTGLTNNTKYYFWVSSCYVTGDESIYCDSVSATPVSSAVTAPTGISAKNTHDSYGNIKFTWNEVANASSYKFYYKPADSSEEAVLLETVTDTEICVDEFSVNTEYYIYITAVVNNIESPFSEKFSVIIPTAPSGLTSESGNESADLSWNAVSGADKYAIYQRNKDGSIYTRIGYSDTNSCSITGLINGNTYYFMVAAVINGVESDFSDIVTAAPTAASDITITTQPRSCTLIGGTRALISIDISGSASSFTWQYNSGSGWKTLTSDSNVHISSGLTSSYFIIYNTAGYKNCQFRCIVTDKNGNAVTTNTATLSFYDESSVTVSMVENLSSTNLTNYVNYFTTLYDDSFVLTAAQFKAIELVLAADYAE